MPINQEAVMTVSYHNRCTILIVTIAAMGSITYGYCSVIISSTLAIPGFLSYMGLDTAPNASQLIGTTNALYQAGGLIGALMSGLTSDRFGRRGAIAIAGTIAVMGGILQTASVHIAMFMVARLVTGLGIGNITTVIPLIQAELSPPKSRGLLVGFHGAFILVGYTSAAWIGAGFYHVPNVIAQWRVPLAFQLVAPVLLVATIFCIPESPRWLLQRGRTKEAEAVCRKLYSNGSHPETQAWRHQFAEIQGQWEIDQAHPSSWLAIATVPSYRKRAIIGFLCLFFGQTTGTLVIANYGPSIYGGLGYGTADQLYFSAGWLTSGLIANFISAFIMDLTGRVKLMVFGLAGCEIALIGAAVTISLNERVPTYGVQVAAVFFIFLHLAFYGTCLDAATYVYGAEIWPNHLRAKGMAISVSGLFVGSLILLCAAPTAFAEIKWRFYLVCIVMTALAMVVMYLFFPEVNGISLEATAGAFGDRVHDMVVADNEQVESIILNNPGKDGEEQKLA